MAKIKLLSVLLITACLTGCYKEPKESSVFYYKNESGHTVSIQQETVDGKAIIVDNGETFKWNGGTDGFPFGDYAEVDVVFDSERGLKFTPDSPADDNILLFSAYVFEKTEKKNGNAVECKFYYTFTPEMYDRAEPIEPV